MDLSGMTISQIIVYGIVIIFIIIVTAFALRFISKGKKIKSPIGSMEDETEKCECSMSTKINEMYDILSTLSVNVNTLVETNNLQSSNIAMLCRVQRPIIRTLRSHSYALKEAGANGSTEKALEHIDEAEDILNDATVKGAKTAMSIGA
jgi:predicted XRE-type DNA-binding protein